MGREQTMGEEIANSITHGIGAAVAVAGTVVLIIRAAMSGSALYTVSVSAYGVTLITLYAASTLYHAMQSPGVKSAMKLADHISIYLLIAGTYTPFSLYGLGGRWGWSVFAIIWTLAVAGVVFKVFFVGRFRVLSTAIYVAMGWIVVIAVVPLVQTLSTATLFWLVAGGLAYTTGTLFYLAHSLPFGHSIWHLFVLAGSIFHYIGIWTLA